MKNRLHQTVSKNLCQASFFFRPLGKGFCQTFAKPLPSAWQEFLKLKLETFAKPLPLPTVQNGKTFAIAKAYICLASGKGFEKEVIFDGQ